GWLLFGGDDGVIPSSVSASYFKNASLITDYPHVKAGDSLVFLREYVAEDREEGADNEYSERFYFTIPKGFKSFGLKGDELNSINIKFLQYCFCMFGEDLEILGGQMTGQLNDDFWTISANIDLAFYYRISEDSLTLAEPINKTFSNKFKLKSLTEVD
ncbi:MAG: hypothetical protein ACI83W_002512, partial [Marinoscillum sp.]